MSADLSARESTCKVNDGVDINVAVDVNARVDVIVEDNVNFTVCRARRLCKTDRRDRERRAAWFAAMISLRMAMREALSVPERPGFPPRDLGEIGVDAGLRCAFRGMQPRHATAR